MDITDVGDGGGVAVNLSKMDMADVVDVIGGKGILVESERGEEDGGGGGHNRKSQ